MVGGSWIVYYVRSPDHRQPFRKCPRWFPIYIILEKIQRDGLDLIDRTGYTSSDGMYLVEQTDPVEQPGYVDRTGEASS